MTDTLVEKFETLHGQNIGASSFKFRFLWSGPPAPALEFLGQDDAVHIITMSPELLEMSYHGATRMADRSEKISQEATKNGQAAANQRKELWDAYLNGQFESNLFGGQSAQIRNFIGGANMEKAIGNGLSSFSTLYQERRTWNHDSAGIYDCYAGCAPVAYTLVLEFWDRNGYPRMSTGEVHFLEALVAARKKSLRTHKCMVPLILLEPNKVTEMPGSPIEEKGC